MIRLAVFGFPVSHSRSPEIHRSFARQFGLEVDYRAIEATAETLPGLLQELASQGGHGCNITVPLKHEAWKLCSNSSNSACTARAANTLLLESADRWYADNTDGRGLVRDLNSLEGRPLSGSRICILGAGGATAGILGDLLNQRPASLLVANRTLARAEQLCKTFSGQVGSESIAAGQSTLSPPTSPKAIALDAVQAQGPFDLIINATSLGHDGRHPELGPGMFHRNSLCYDLNYGPASTPLRRFCQETGVAYRDGLGMLVEQAALSFELWTAKRPETQAVLEKLTASYP